MEKFTSFITITFPSEPSFKEWENITKEFFFKDEKIVIPELDDTTAMLAYTQEIKDSAGVKDSFTEEKTDAIKKQE